VLSINQKIIIALDFNSKVQTDSFLKTCPSIKSIKIGLELFTSEGVTYLQELKARGYFIFLDLRLHDIPQTVAKTLKVISNYRIDLTTVHIGGGEEMLSAAKEAAGAQTKVLGVSALTSLSEEELQNTYSTTSSLNDFISSQATIAERAGVDGMICSPLEVKKLKQEFPKLLFVTPGIRLEKTQDDQKRIATPQQAIQNGADYLVIGRPITQSESPEKTLNEILKRIEQA